MAKIKTGLLLAAPLALTLSFADAGQAAEDTAPAPRESYVTAQSSGNDNGWSFLEVVGAITLAGFALSALGGSGGGASMMTGNPTGDCPPPPKTPRPS